MTQSFPPSDKTPAEDGPTHAIAHSLNRRQILQCLTSAGLAAIGGMVFTRALADEIAAENDITPEMISNAEWIAGLTLSETQREQAADAMNNLRESFRSLRALELDPSEAPVLTFYPSGSGSGSDANGSVSNAASLVERPASDEELAFLSVGELARLLRSSRVTSLELTKLYLSRLKRYDKTLKCVITLTEDLALRQAERADDELRSGKDRGPLHGIPWGAKDLIAYPGYPTTWGAEPFREQVREEKATVAERLDQAGAVLVAKLSLGALAWGDRWFGGVTRNPWNPKQGSSGSSAGSAAATVAGLVGFSLGSETLGSIMSPCRRCSATGLRPTFGRVSRWGCMPLAWSMDKIGPITRSVADCALILNAIHGADGKDESAVNQPFHWPGKKPISEMRIGYVENGRSASDRSELETLEMLGAELVEIQLPTDPPAEAMHPILNVEAASAFDRLTRNGVEEGLFRWPTAFRQGQLTPAVEYLRAQRLRRRLISAVNHMFETQRIDLYVEGDDLMITNLTGHPSVALRKEAGGVAPNAQPRSFTMTGKLFGETELLTAAHAYEQARGLHRLHPEMPAQRP